MWTLNFTFPNNNFTNGKFFRFNNGRGQWQDATVPQGMTLPPVVGGRQDYSADMLGSGVLLPEYADAPTILPGMTFSATIVDGANTYPISGRLTNKIGRGYSPVDGYGFINVEAAATGVVPVPGVVSRKTHGTAGDFDIPLPFNGTAGVECRVPGPDNSYTLVFTFDRPVANAGTVSIQGTGSVAPAPNGSANPSIGGNSNEVIVNLNGVTDQQHLVVTLSNVRDSSGNTFSPVPARMDVLVGDVDASGVVTSGDTNLCKAQALQPLTADNFRNDVNVSGQITTGDANLIKQNALNHLP
jgi:hypothetical protein